MRLRVVVPNCVRQSLRNTDRLPRSAQVALVVLDDCIESFGEIDLRDGESPGLMIGHTLSHKRALFKNGVIDANLEEALLAFETVVDNNLVALVVGQIIHDWVVSENVLVVLPEAKVGPRLVRLDGGIHVTCKTEVEVRDAVDALAGNLIRIGEANLGTGEHALDIVAVVLGNGDLPTIIVNGHAGGCLIEPVVIASSAVGAGNDSPLSSSVKGHLVVDAALTGNVEDTVGN